MATVDLLWGKATVPQAAFRFGFYPKTVENRCEVALEGIEHTLAPAGHLAGNAAAEGFVQALKVKLVWTRGWETLQRASRSYHCVARAIQPITGLTKR